MELINEKELNEIKKFIEIFGYPDPGYDHVFEVRIRPGSLTRSVEISKIGEDEITSDRKDITDYENIDF